MSFRSSRVIGASVLASAALAGSVAVAAASDSSASAVPACTGGALRIAAVGGEGAAGHGYYMLDFKNETRSTCSLYGYPGLDAVTSHGHVLAHAKREPNPGHRAHTIVLAPKAHATALVGFADMRAGGECPLAHHVAITPPNTSRTVHRTRPTYLCDLFVRPVVAG